MPQSDGPVLTNVDFLTFFSCRIFPPHLFLSRYIYLLFTTLPHFIFCPHSSLPSCSISTEEFLSRRVLPLRKHPFCHHVFPDYKQLYAAMQQVNGCWRMYRHHFSSFEWYCHYTVGNRNRMHCNMMTSWKIGVGWGSVIQFLQTLSKLKNIAYEVYRIFIGDQLVTFSKSLLRVLVVL